MNSKLLLEYTNFSQLLLCVGLLFLLKKRESLQQFRYLAIFIALQVTTEAISIPVLFFRKSFGLSKLAAYNIMFFAMWPCLILQAVLMVVVVYGIYSLALEPFEPLKKLGTIMFRWAAAISVAVSLAVAIGPHMLSSKAFALNVVSQIQQSTSVLTLCLLLFVCIALRPLGLNIRSRAFGASLGLGILAAVQLIQAAWFPTLATHSMYSPVFMYSGLASCAAFLVWGAYFAFPEPQRRMVLLPTTSPYFFWNRVSEALGDAPGYVAVSGFSPDALAPGELHALMAADEEDTTPRLLQPIAVNQ